MSRRPFISATLPTLGIMVLLGAVADIDAACDGSCTIRATDYDRSCAKESDCTGVAEGDFCGGTTCTNCINAAINTNAEAQYQADVSKNVSKPIDCPCPSPPPLSCVNGTCTVGPFTGPPDASGED
jgi:hypothetical protein